MTNSCSRRAKWCGLFTTVIGVPLAATAYLANQATKLCDMKGILSSFSKTTVRLSNLKVEIELGEGLPPLIATMKSMNFTLADALKNTELPSFIQELPALVSNACKDTAWFEGVQSMLIILGLGLASYAVFITRPTPVTERTQFIPRDDLESFPSLSPNY